MSAKSKISDCTTPRVEPELDRDLAASSFILEKVKKEEYAQHLYAAMCNVTWIKDDLLSQLADSWWGVSWRRAGTIVSTLRGTGDYQDFYCSGIGDRGTSVEEGTVTDEIAADLKSLGWVVFETAEKD